MLSLIAIPILTPRDSIDGIWRNHFYTSCLCDSYNFLEFNEGKIRYVSDTHLSGETVGTYRKIQNHRFEIEILSDTGPPMIFTVYPKLVHFMTATGHGMPYDHWMARLFYRPLDSDKVRSLIEEIPIRNREIREREVTLKRLEKGEEPASVLE